MESGAAPPFTAGRGQSPRGNRFQRFRAAPCQRFSTNKKGGVCLLNFFILLAVYHFCIHIADFAYIAMSDNLTFSKNNGLVTKLTDSVGAV